MIVIKKIKWIAEEAREAELTISDGFNKCKVFAQPFRGKVNDIVKEPLCALFCENIYLSHNSEPAINMNSDDSFLIISKVVNMKKNLVCVGEIIIELDSEIPKDIYNGCFVQFTCSRFDFLG